MNSAKYKNVIYDVRPISDLREMINGSCELFENEDAFLVKDKPGGEYRPITFKQFNSDINSLGTAFINHGLKDKKIAVIGENSYQWVVTYFATVNGTGVIVPIDRELKAQDIAYLLKTADVSAVVYSKKVNKVMDEVLKDEQLKENIKCTVTTNFEQEGSYTFDQLIEEGQKCIKEGNRQFIDAPIDNEALAALLFTSGTTGVAKGVMLSHKNISANVYNMAQYVKVGPEDTGLSVLPMHHTYEMTCHVMCGLYQGMTVAICEGLKHIQKNMAEVPATIMLAVPLIFETMHKKVWKKAKSSGSELKMRRAANLSKKLKLYNRPAIVKKIFKPVHQATGGAINLFIAGGAAINPQVIEDYQAMGIPMIQGYGMTENAPIIAVNKDHYSRPDSVGLAMPGTEIKIIDKDEDGVGEIICKGPSVMLGYYKNPVATSEAIIDGWLHTGDYGYMDEEGFLYISGRKKSVIVTKNGKNIMPEEIEYLLGQYDYIAEVLVHGIEGERNDDVVVKAEIYPNYQLIYDNEGQLGEDQLRELLNGIVEEVNEQMPNYKRVKRFGIRKNEFEKTTTKKIKRYLESNLNEELGE